MTNTDNKKEFFNALDKECPLNFYNDLESYQNDYSILYIEKARRKFKISSSLILKYMDDYGWYSFEYIFDQLELAKNHA